MPAPVDSPVLHAASPLLWIPLLGAIIFSVGAIVMKSTMRWRIDAWRVTFLSNVSTMFVFMPLALLKGGQVHWPLLWQPLFTSVLFIAGQITTMMALTRGDVSIVTPVLGLKIILVAIFSTVLLGSALPSEIWLASGLATAGVALLNISGRRQQTHNAVYSILMGLASASAFGLFDICVQVWSPGWGVGRFLPVMFLCSGTLSLLFIPLFQEPLWKIPTGAWPWLIAGCLLISAQAFCIVFTIATWGQAATANVLYSTRGVWSVLLVWLLGSRLGAAEVASGATVWLRLSGAVLLLGAVVLLLT